MKRLVRWGMLAAVLVLLADQASKWWVLEVLDLPSTGPIPVIPYALSLAFVRNYGVTFGLLNGLGAWAPWVLGGTALAVVAVLGVWLSRADSLWTAIPIGAIAGGAVGNVIDRMRFGWVVDFLHATPLGPSRDVFPYVFNVADAAIVCGVAALLLDGLRPRRPGATGDRLQPPGVRQ